VIPRKSLSLHPNLWRLSRRFVVSTSFLDQQHHETSDHYDNDDLRQSRIADTPSLASRDNIADLNLPTHLWSARARDPGRGLSRQQQHLGWRGKTVCSLDSFIDFFSSLLSITASHHSLFCRAPSPTSARVNTRILNQPDSTILSLLPCNRTAPSPPRSKESYHP
jgi:hypothetical protein